MATFTKLFPTNGGNDNDSILITASNTPIHEPTYATGQKDEIWLWFNNPSSVTEVVELIWTNNMTFPSGNTMQKFEVPPYSTILAMPGIPMASADPNVSGYYNYIIANTVSGNTVYCMGYVNRIS